MIIVLDYICIVMHNICMAWSVVLHPDFEQEVRVLDKEVRQALAARAKLLAEIGPRLGRPYVDTLGSSKHSNMKELRFDACDGVWRVAFAFDLERQAVLLLLETKVV